MIKNLHIITDLDTGGAEMMLYKLLSGMSPSRYEPIVITLMNKDTRISRCIEELNVPVYALDMAQGQISFTILLRLLKIIRTKNPDIIQGWMYHGNMAASISRILSLQKIPVLWNIRHSMHNLKYEKRTTAAIIRAGAIFSKTVTRIIYNSRVGARQHEKLGYSGDRTIVIPNGFDCDRFKPSTSARQILRKNLNVSQDSIIVGSIGRFHPQKDYNNLLSAAGILTKKYMNLHFVLIGRGIEQNNSEIAELISQNKLTNRVHLLGERQDIPEIIAGMDIITSSSSYGEAFPNVIGEAMASGIPCVVTNVGDSAWIVGNSGKVVPPRDAQALATACKELIDAGLSERVRLGKVARQRILDNFSIEKIVARYEELYKQIVLPVSNKE